MRNPSLGRLLQGRVARIGHTVVLTRRSPGPPSTSGGSRVVDSRIAGDTDPLTILQQQARQRFASWDPAVFEDLLTGPAVTVARRFADLVDGSSLFDAWLELSVEAIGLRLIADPAFAFVWTEAGPRAVAAASTPTARLEVLASAFNLGENLATKEPAWLGRVIARIGRTAANPDLAKLVDDAARAIGAAAPLARDARTVVFASSDPQFLPGRITFPSPRVAVVIDRLRPAIAEAVWFGDEDAISLGATQAPALKDTSLSSIDLRFVAVGPGEEVFAAARSGDVEGAALVTSQLVLFVASSSRGMP